MAKRKKNSVADGGTDLVFTISTLLPREKIPLWGRFFLADYAEDFNCAKHDILKSINTGEMEFKTLPGEVRHSSIYSLRLPSRMVNAGILQALLGEYHSQREVDKSFLETSMFKLNRVEKEKTKLLQAKQNLFLDSKKTYTKEEADKLYQEGMEKLFNTNKEYAYRKNRLAEAEARYIDDRLRICFGSRGLLRKRSKIISKDTPEYVTWKKAWDTARFGTLFFVGSTDETMGCSNAHVVWRLATEAKKKALQKEIETNKSLKTRDIKRKKREMEGQFFLRITVPTYYRDVYQETRLEVPIDIGMYEKELRSHIHFHETTNKETIKEHSFKSSLAVRLIKQVNGDYAVRISLNTDRQASRITTHKEKGTIGVDFNNGHFDMVEVDRHGNFLNYTLIEANLDGLSSKQRTTVLSEATLKFVLYAKLMKKTLILEDLDFTKKKACLSKNDNTENNKMLSEFPYAKAREFVRMQCYKHGVALEFVDPSYTSQIGEIKYSPLYGLDRHGGAAMVIARRGMGFKERLPVVDNIPTPKKVRGEAPHPEKEVKDKVVKSYKKNSLKKKPVLCAWQPRGLLITPKRLTSTVERARRAIYFKVYEKKKKTRENILKQQKSVPFLSQVSFA